MGHAAIYDPVRDRMVIFAGDSYDVLNDTWALSLAGTPEWNRLEPGGALPPPMAYQTAIYGPDGDQMVIFSSGNWDHLNRAWSLSFEGSPTWTELAPAGTPPPGRMFHTAIYDSSSTPHGGIRGRAGL